MPASGSSRGWFFAALLALLLGAHLALRIIPAWPELVQSDGRIFFPDNDSWFHHREALYTNAHFPAIQRTEDISRYPEVERMESSGLWDVTLAGLARIAALGRPSPSAVSWVCLLLPPLAGAGVFLLLFRVVSANAPPASALGVWLVAWAVLAPGNTLSRTGLGVCDHHVAEMLLSLVCLLAVLRVLRRAEASVSAGPALPWWRHPPWLEALPLAVFVFTWEGAPIYLLLTALVFGAAVIAAVLKGAPARPLALAGARLMAMFVLMAGLAGWLWPALVMHIVLFSAALTGAALTALGLPLVTRLLEASARRIGPGRSVVVFLVIASTGFAAAYAASAQVREITGFLLGRKSPLVQENHPVTLSYYFWVTGLPGLIAIAAPAVGIVTGAWKRTGWLVTVAWSFALLMLWYRTWDYDYLGGLHALVLAGCVLGAFGGAAPVLSGRVLSAMTALIAIGSIGFGIGGPPYVSRAIYHERLVLVHAGWQQAMDWLHAQPPPPPPDFTQPLPRGRSGVLTDWAHGNLINTLGGWPAVSARYLDKESLLPLLLTDEAAVRASPLRGSDVASAVRYVVLDASFLGQFFQGMLLSADFDPATFVVTETLRPPSAVPRTVTTFGPRYRSLFAYRLLVDGGAGLQHFRLVYESPQETFLRQRFVTATHMPDAVSDLIETPAQRTQTAAALASGFWHEPDGDAYAGHIVPGVRIYEQVPGARITGSALPGALVTLTLPLRVRTTDRRFVYEQTALADAASGAFSLIVPYATEPTSASDVLPDGPAVLTTSHIRRTVEIPEAAVQVGGTLPLTPPSP